MRPDGMQLACSLPRSASVTDLQNLQFVEVMNIIGQLLNQENQLLELVSVNLYGGGSVYQNYESFSRLY